MNDLVRLACERAVVRFGGKDGIFNAACFAHDFADLADMNGLLDGEYVRAILCGRPDIEVLPGNYHYKLKG